MPKMVRRWIGIVAAVGGLALVLPACRRHGSAPSAPAARTAAGAAAVTGPGSQPAAGQFQSGKDGVALTIPAGWVARASKDYVLMLVPRSAGESTERSISLDRPDLPVHIPGMIPLGLVKNGYVDDLKKQYGQVETVAEPALDVPKAELRQVKSTYRVQGKGFSEVALLMVHGDHVYILRGTTDEAGYEATRGAFEAVAKSLKWMK